MATAKKRAQNEDAAQLSLFDSLFGEIDSFTEGVSSDDLKAALDTLAVKYEQAIEREETERARLAEERRKDEERQQELTRKAHAEAVTCMDLPLSWENLFDADERAAGVHAESISDGLILCLNALGRVDIEYIASITGETYKAVIGALKGSIYQNPDKWAECFYKGWETADEYLSGNLMRKYKAAKEANKAYFGYFEDNVKAIERVLPPAVACEDIYVTLGSPWVPADVIDDFIEHLLGWLHFDLDSDSLCDRTRHDDITGTWEIPNKTRYRNGRYDTLSRSTYGTERMEALYIIEKTLNMQSLTVMKKIPCSANASGVKRIVDQDETLLVMEKQKKIIEAFQKWIWKNEWRKERLEIIFENSFSCVRKRNYDGSFLTFPTMSPHVQLYPYQKNAVARILFSPNTLLAHKVGAGKTYIMIAAGMEMRRMGTSKKNLYVVPNNLVGQWRNIFLQMYPGAKLLCVTPNVFTPQKREKVLASIRDNDYDGILMAYSCFDRIPLSKQAYRDRINEQMERVRSAINAENKHTKKLDERKKALDDALKKLRTSLSDFYGVICFDALGVTTLFVDEAHNYKNVPIETQMNHMPGISQSGSAKCKDMMDKVWCVQKANGGRGVVMATGTPITNSITDLFVMQKYLQSGELALLELQSFDAWVGMFAEKADEFEIDVDTSSYRLATRFSKFHNLPELTSLLSSVADFCNTEDAQGVPLFRGHTDALVAKTPGFQDYLKNISSRADAVRRGLVPREHDNMLKITTDGRKAALDLRLAVPAATFTYQSKVARCAENVFDIYVKTSASRSTQLIFCDTSTPKVAFNIYDELLRLLTQMGVSPDRIAYIHDAATERKRAQLFRDMQSGRIRILIGSTFKLGLGVNVQDRLIAVHHLDVPWRPADMVQREGRILRPGNQNKEVHIFRYITEGSFDAYSWQLLETKQRFICALLSGFLSDRSGADIDDTALSYAEIKALAVGNPLIKERVETANELDRYMILQRKLIEARQAMEQELSASPGRIAEQERLLLLCEKDLADYNAIRAEHDKKKRKEIRERIYAVIRENTLETSEREILSYQGFTVVAPANMLKEKPFVWLKRNGKYYVELGDTGSGVLVRIDNFLHTLVEYRARLQSGLEAMLGKAAALKTELGKSEGYSEQIAACRKRLKEIDKNLGVNKE